MPIKLPNLSYIKNMDQRLYETIVALHNGVEALAKQAGIGAGAQIAAPPTIGKISVTAANGIFHVSITDNTANTHFGINYFIEYADNPVFNNAKTEFLGPSRDKEGWNLGSRTLYFRAFSQYPSSPPSARVVFGGVATPTAVVGGGSAPPAQLPTNGSGSGQGGGFGGKNPRIPIL